MRYSNYSPIKAIANTSITSIATEIQQVYKMSYQLVASTGTISGSLQAQVSNDDTMELSIGKTPTPTNWSNLGSPTTISSSGNILVPEQDMCYRFLRFIYTDSSGGTGTSTLSVQVMQLGV
jgi:hypothetical protein